MAKNDSAELNYDMNYNLFLLKTSMQNLKSAQDKHCVNRWMQKLLSSHSTIAEMKLRNDFMFHLVMAAREDELRAPFNQFPPAGSLKDLAYLLQTGGRPGQVNREGRECDQQDEDADSPASKGRPVEGGAFLAAKPVPKCGAFCYLAVISKPPPKDDRPKL